MYLVSIFGVSISSLNLFLITVACLCVYRLLSRQTYLPPGPRFRFPIIGNLLDVTPDIRIFLTDFRKRYGDVYSLYLGKHLAVVISGYDAIKEALQRDGDLFSDRHNSYLFDQVSEGGKVDQLAHVITDLFFAGTDTTAATLAWALVYLVNYPEIQGRMFAEIRNYVGTDRLPAVDDKDKLPFTEAVYMEVLRHAELISLGFARSVSCDVQFRGYVIPKGAMILPDIHSVLKDPAIWVDPDTFNPDRFIADDGSVRRPEQFIPFSTGRRNCLGNSLAKMELFLFLSALVQRFEFRPPPGADLSLPTLDGVFGIVHSPKPFNVVAVRRG